MLLGRDGAGLLGTRPSKKSVSRIIGAIHECTDRRTTWQEAEALVSNINGKLVGWANYFSLGPVSKAYLAIEQYTKRRLRRWLYSRGVESRCGAVAVGTSQLFAAPFVWRCRN